MARKLRVEYAGAIYHVMNRGDRREPIYKDAVDRRRFIETLGEACTKTGWQVHAYPRAMQSHAAGAGATVSTRPLTASEPEDCLGS